MNEKMLAKVSYSCSDMPIYKDFGVSRNMLDFVLYCNYKYNTCNTS